MNERAQSDPPRTVLDEAAGREATAEQLRAHLLSAPAAYLSGAAGNPRLAEPEMLMLLRNRQATPKLLASIAKDRGWTRSREVKKQLVQHPRIPVALARGLLPHLFWKELADISTNLRVHPVVRRQALELVKVRLEELSLGEKVALSRRAPRGLIGSLIETHETPVLRALLGNNGLVELEAVRVASSPRATADLFRQLAEHPRWGARPAVRLALLRNRRAPVPVALRVLEKLPQTDLRRVSKDDKVPKIVRVGADRRLARAPTRPDAGASKK